MLSAPTNMPLTQSLHLQVTASTPSWASHVSENHMSVDSWTSEQSWFLPSQSLLMLAWLSFSFLFLGRGCNNIAMIDWRSDLGLRGFWTGLCWTEAWVGPGVQGIHTCQICTKRVLAHCSGCWRFDDLYDFQGLIFTEGCLMMTFLSNWCNLLLIPSSNKVHSINSCRFSCKLLDLCSTSWTPSCCIYS